MDSDGQLLKRIKAGDREALALLYGRYLPSVWRYVYAQLRGDEQTCRDVVSETFMAAIRNLTHANGSVASVGAWLTGIARHKLRDSRRLSVKHAATKPPDMPSVDDAPTLPLEAADTRWLVARVMTQMEELERTVLEWKYIEELSVHDIAQRLDRTDKAVEATLYRARNSFRALFDKTANPSSDTHRRLA